MSLGHGASVPVRAGSRGKSRVASLILHEHAVAQVPPNRAPGFPGPCLSVAFSFKLNTSVYELLHVTDSALN